MYLNRKPLSVEATQVSWNNLAEFEAFTSEEVIPGDSIQIVYVNRLTADDGTKKVSITLREEGEDSYDFTKEMGVIVPRGDGQFLLANEGDWVCVHESGMFPLTDDEREVEWDFA